MEDLRKDEFTLANGTKFVLTMFDPQTLMQPRTYIQYELTRDGKVLFSGNDIGCSPLHAIDSDITMLTLMSFLCVVRGGVDSEYFDSYNDEQMVFMEGEANDLMQVAAESFQEAARHLGYDFIDLIVGVLE